MESYDPEPDYTDEKWMNEGIESALNDFLSTLYIEGVGISKVTINVAHLPGDPFSINTDYGTVEFTGEEAR